ncbi:rhodanese-like domain-containing protein [Oceanispirochaeta crateris]|uniref:Rhodanese-like domain-containing protein n=1 Tax=Oceanispirochaeta crateris TaxID=2518645 RepID=A0A5C1QQY7_9SPIO|nr:rhodanese-like domain-containing protein [Oceanispirochaeta crateris]QEN09034.1 rhodanese-like domain-containing protein [Oceanispirochaeta crateris]
MKVKIMKRAMFMIVMIVSISGFAIAEAADYREESNLKSLIESDRDDYLFIDVRTGGEYASGHIPKSLNIPYETLPSSLPHGTEKDALIILYCRSGNRSGIATRALEKAGYTNVQDFGGIGRWSGTLEK